MTEAEWLACEQPLALVEAHEHRRHETERKARLFAIACCRSAVKHLNVGGQDAIEIAEKFADGIADQTELRLLRSRFDQLARPYRASALAILRLAVGDTDAPAHLLQRCIRIVELLTAISLPRVARIDRDIFGNPFRRVSVDTVWLTPTVVGLATGIYADRAFDRMPILADALEEAGCDNADVLTHCREPGEHVRGCWVVDLLLGKA